MIQNKPVFFNFSNTAFVGLKQFDNGLQAGVLQELMEGSTVLRQEAHALNHGAAVFVLAKFKRHPIYLVPAFVEPFLFDAANNTGIPVPVPAGDFVFSNEAKAIIVS